MPCTAGGEQRVSCSIVYIIACKKNATANWKNTKPGVESSRLCYRTDDGRRHFASVSFFGQFDAVNGYNGITLHVARPIANHL